MIIEEIANFYLLSKKVIILIYIMNNIVYPNYGEVFEDITKQLREIRALRDNEFSHEGRRRLIALSLHQDIQLLAEYKSLERAFSKLWDML